MGRWLLRCIASHCANENATAIRYDYDPLVNRFVIRMATIIHDYLLDRVLENITTQLRSLCHALPEPIASAVSDTETQGNARVDLLDGPYHSPDGAFRHSTSQFPRVIIEVSYTQKRKDLARLADNYIVGSNGNIGLVIGLDLGRNTVKEAHISLWRPKIILEDDGKSYLVSDKTETVGGTTLSGY
jgi:hypothetical protein